MSPFIIALIFFLVSSVVQYVCYAAYAKKDINIIAKILFVSFFQTAVYVGMFISIFSFIVGTLPY